MIAPRIIGPEVRLSRPTVTVAPAPSIAAYAQPNSHATRGVNVPPTVPRTPETLTINLSIRISANKGNDPSWHQLPPLLALGGIMQPAATGGGFRPIRSLRDLISRRFMTGAEADLISRRLVSGAEGAKLQISTK
jgi:hypothetical protein